MPYVTELALSSDLEWEEAAKFRSQTRSVLALIERGLPSIYHEQAKKILVTCRVDPPQSEPRIIGGVLEVYVQGDARCFKTMSATDKTNFAVDILLRGLEKACAWAKLEFAPFRYAVEKAKERQFINSFRSPKKPKTSPNRRLTAVLDCYHGQDSFIATLVVADRKGNERLRIVAFESRPSEYSFVPKLKTLKWIDNDTLFVDGQIFKVLV